jgi:hypothetical protein
VRGGNYKLTHADLTAPPKLFNLSKDPGESNDLAAKRPDLVQPLKSKYDAWNSTLAPPLWRDIPEERSGQRLARIAATTAPTR